MTFRAAHAVDPDADLLGIGLGVFDQLLSGLELGGCRDHQNVPVLDQGAQPDALLQFHLGGAAEHGHELGRGPVHHDVGVSSLGLQVVQGHGGGAALARLGLDLGLDDPGLVEDIARGQDEQTCSAAGGRVVQKFNDLVRFRIGGLSRWGKG